jgi:Lon protease-like protein
MAESRDLGLFPLDLVLLPGEFSGLHIFETRYRQLLADSVLDDLPFVLGRPDPESGTRIACSARFHRLERRYGDGRLDVLVRGEAPVEIAEETDGRLYFSAMTHTVDDDPGVASDGRIAAAREAYDDFVSEVVDQEAHPAPPDDVPLSYGLASTLDLASEPKQSLLDTRSEEERLTQLTAILRAARESVLRARVAAERAPTNGKVSH